MRAGQGEFSFDGTPPPAKVEREPGWWERAPYVPPWKIGKPVKFFPRGRLSADEYVREILRRAGKIVEGDPDWLTPQEQERWLHAPRDCLGGRCWADVCEPLDPLRFIAHMKLVDRDLGTLT